VPEHPSISLDTFLGNRLATSVRVGSLWVPANYVERAFARYVNRPLYFSESGKLMYLLGSASNISIAGRFFVVCCKHQLSDVQVQHVLFSTEQDFRFRNGERFVFADTPEDKDFEQRDDLCFFDVTSAVLDGRLNAANFFSIDGDLALSASDDPIAFVVRGFAFDDNTVQVPDDFESDFSISGVHGVNRSFVCLEHDDSSDQTLLCLLRGEEFGISVNGFSGAPAFALVYLSDGFISSKFAGLVARGGGRSFYIIRAKFVHDFLTGAL